MTDRPIPSPSPGRKPPDAARWPKKPDEGREDREKETAVEAAERLLEIDPTGRDLAWVRDQVTYYLATREADCDRCSEFYPAGHPREGGPRYRWEDLGEGVRLGWLVG